MGRRVKIADLARRRDQKSLQSLNDITRMTTHENEDEQSPGFNKDSDINNNDGVVQAPSFNTDDIHNDNVVAQAPTHGIIGLAHEHPAVRQEMEKVIGTFGQLNCTPAPQMPPMIPPIHPANFQPLSRPSFVAGLPLNYYQYHQPHTPAPNNNLAIQYQSPPKLPVRKKDRVKRKERRCKLFCGSRYCEGAKSGPIKNYGVRRCSNLIIGLLDVLHEDKTREGHAAIVNIASSNDRVEQLKLLACFLKTLWDISGKPYDDVEYWKHLSQLRVQQ